MSSNRQYAIGAAAGVASVAGAFAAWKVVNLLRNGDEDASSLSLTTQGNRSKRVGYGARWTKPVVIAGTPGLEELSSALSSALGCEKYTEAEGHTVCMEKFKSGDPNMRFNWQRVVGRKIIFLFDTVDQSALFEQLSLLQAFQGFAIPDPEDKSTKWKTYSARGKYTWGRASHITVVLPWYRPCQMERTSRWSLKDGKWTNGDPEGRYLDVPTAQYMARLLATPGSVPPLPGPTSAQDDMPLHPLWRPPLELLFIELHEEAPIKHAASDLGATIRMERFVPFFLERFKSDSTYPGAESVYVLFPDRGAYARYQDAIVKVLGLASDHILYIEKTRVGDAIEQVQTLFYEKLGCERGTKSSFAASDHVLIIDDFTNSGSTLFGAVSLCTQLAGGATLGVSIFVSHLVALYDAEVVKKLADKLHSLGPKCRFITTNSVPMTTSLLKSDPQVEILSIADFLAHLLAKERR
mmetsp:Transcript_54391/g.100480  ORF Transcript_54391/g.100480 Transcript_54391/m.100480 type:complete len:466 (+) Transcript_54391:62-1459(+)